MQQRLRHQLLIVLAGGVVFFTQLGTAGLWNLDEPLYASCARDMLARGDWVLPTYNGEVFYDKPPLMFWLMMGSFKLLGATEFAARLCSALLGIGTALATYHLGRRLFSPEAGFWAGLIMVSTVMFTWSARAATVDAALVFVTTLGLLAFTIGSRTAMALMYLLFGIAILAKGPVGFLLPLATIGLYRLTFVVPPSGGMPSSHATRWLRHFLRVTWSLRPLTGLALSAAVALPWYILVAVRTHGDWLMQFIEKYNVDAFRHPSYGHSGLPLYHFGLILIGLFPWSVFIGPMLWHAVRAIRQRSPARDACLLCLCWIGVFFVFWSACSTKLPHYVLPAYPPLALLTACFLQDWLDHAENVHRRWLVVGAAIVIVVGFVMLVGLAVLAMLATLPWLAARHVPGDAIIGLVGLPLVLGGGLCLYELRRGRRARYVQTFAVTSLVFITMLFGWATVRIDRHQHSRPLMAAIRRDCPAEPQVATFCYLHASTVFYAGGPLPRLEKIDEVRDFLRDNPHAYLITTDEHYADLDRAFAGTLRVVARRPQFLARGEVLALGR